MSQDGVPNFSPAANIAWQSDTPEGLAPSIFRQPDRQILALSPFRLGEEPNVRMGVAMITSAPEALSLHQKQAEGMWHRALKGPAAARFLRDLIARHKE